MLWLLTVVTVVVVLAIGQLVRDIAKTPTVAAQAALSRSARTASSASAHAAARRVSPRSKATSAPSGPQVRDTSSGLSYAELASPWQAGCPAVLKTPMFSWSAGESAVAGQVIINGSVFDWHGNACSGVLQQQFKYSGRADLETTATSLVAALDQEALHQQGDLPVPARDHYAHAATLLTGSSAAAREPGYTLGR